MGEIYGMVRRLRELVQNPHAAPCLGGGAEDGKTEHLAGYRLRAGESEEHASRTNFLKSTRIELLVTTQAVADRAAVLGERRGVKYYQVILVLLHIGKELEGVGIESAVTAVVREIKADVGVGQSDRLRRRVDGIHAQCTAAHGIDRESAGIAEHI